MSAFDALLKPTLTPTAPSGKTGGSAFNALLTTPIAQNRAKAAVQVAANPNLHTYNPLNPNNQIAQTFPIASPLKEALTPHSLRAATWTVAQQVPQAIKNTFSGPAAIVKSEIHPSDTEKTLENNVPKSLFKSIGTPLLRAAEPMFEGYGTQFGNIIAQNEESKQIAQAKPVIIGKQPQPTVQNAPAGMGKLTADDYINSIVNSASVAVAIAPIFSRVVAEGSLGLADAITKNAKVPITYADMQKITTSGSDAEAISRVGQEKFDAFKEATKTDQVRTALKQGYVELAQKDPSTAANLLRNAATRPVSEIANFGKQYGAAVKTTIPPLLNETNPEFPKSSPLVEESQPSKAIVKAEQSATPTEFPKQSPLPVEVPKVEAPKVAAPQTDLVSEAKKYKSADEFVKAQGKPVFHGSDKASLIEKEGFKIMPSESARGYGDGIYFTDTKSNAKGYGDVVKSYIPQDLKLYQATEADTYNINTKKLISEGYDGVKLPGTGGFTIFDTTKINTQSQLTDIWNKANQAEVAPVENKTPSKIAQSINQKAVDAGLTKNFSNLAGYDKITIADQAAKSSDLVTNHLQDARAIIRGEKPLPDGLKGTALITAMEEHIKANPNADLSYELANSPLVSGTSHAAQELRLAAEREPDSATAKLAEMKQKLVEKAGGEKAVAKQRASVIKQLREATQKVNLTKEELSWEKFIKEVTC